MQQIISTLSLIIKPQVKFTWEILVCIILETMMELIDLLLHF
jgi:hypothetical protein